MVVNDLSSPNQRRLPVVVVFHKELLTTLGSILCRKHVVRIRHPKITVEAMVRWQMFRQVTKMPLSDQARRVAFLLQHLCNGDLILRQSAGRVVSKHSKLIMAHSVSNGIASGQQSRTTGSAHFRCRIEFREAHPFRGHTVKIRRSNRGMPIAAKVTITQVIGVNDDDIGAVRSRRITSLHCWHGGHE